MDEFPFRIELNSGNFIVSQILHTLLQKNFKENYFSFTYVTIIIILNKYRFTKFTKMLNCMEIRTQFHAIQRIQFVSNFATAAIWYLQSMLITGPLHNEIAGPTSISIRAEFEETLFKLTEILMWYL